MTAETNDTQPDASRRCELCGDPVDQHVLTADSHPEGVNHLVGECCAEAEP